MAVAAAAPLKPFTDTPRRLPSPPSSYPCKGGQIPTRLLDLSSSFIAKMLSNTARNGGLMTRRRRRSNGFRVVDELGGQYDDTFIDVKLQIMNYFTIKAVRTVLDQLYELNPPQYKWFNNFAADNEPRKAKRFLQSLVKERQELAERVMITRLALYSRWIKVEMRPWGNVQRDRRREFEADEREASRNHHLAF
ncbi:chaperonin-like RbcX protein 2, chloroplastic isoform X2 [Andrographis paniculata]|uniref:chaperonin-like RbcX protein 2, chloroplastic isoform X2 n=1 Tax=Andrographis paniculata TaxID=175694 RepID=UPI0021E73BC2|nr:chaperonin-like RbcX protein 2, chloroplastic isoform X2 [Andrographis paniculata]